MVNDLDAHLDYLTGVIRSLSPARVDELFHFMWDENNVHPDVWARELESVDALHNRPFEVIDQLGIREDLDRATQRIEQAITDLVDALPDQFVHSNYGSDAVNSDLRGLIGCLAPAAVLRPHLGQQTRFTRGDYRWLTATWSAVVGPAHPNDR